MIRITGGSLRGRHIESPPRSKNIRPTTSMIRESLFNRLQPVLQSCRFLDLFAGSGIMGIEAISRGAAFVLAVEQDAMQVRRIRQNLAQLRIPEALVKAIQHDALALMAKPCREGGFDVIFIDPPYGSVDLKALIGDIDRNGWLNPGGWLMIEHGSRDDPLEGFIRKDYGDTAVSIRTSPGDSR